MTSLPPQPPDNLYQVAASILEPEVPAGGVDSPRRVRFWVLIRSQRRLPAPAARPCIGDLGADLDVTDMRTYCEYDYEPSGCAQ
jgi:hypothetical protein